MAVIFVQISHTFYKGDDTMEPLKYAYGYVRVSTGKQDELSPESQERLLKDYAKSNNIVLLDTFFEHGISGRRADKRPEFQRMIGMAKSKEHPVDLILVWKFSRFARNQEESIVYKSLLKKQNNVDVVSISEPLIDGPFGSLIERIIEWMDEYYSIRLSGEVLRGMTEKAMREGYQTAPPLGYNAVGEGKPFTINEEKYKIVNLIFDEYDNRNSDFTKIARKLNALHYLTQRGKPFEARSIKRILQNPFYYGLVTWRDISFIGSHEVRLTKEQFEQRMDKMQRNFKPARRRDVSTCKHWLSGLIKCGYCGATLAWNGGNPHSPGFQCWQYSKGMHKESCSLSASKATAAVYEYFEQILSGMDFNYKYHAPETPQKIDRRAQLMEELEKLSTREARIRLAYENEVDTLEEYRENKKRLNLARIDIQNELDNLDATPKSDYPSREDVLSKVQTVYDIIKDDSVDYETKGIFMRSLIEDIVYDKKNGQMIFTLYIS